jgi:hypothetical protein
MPRRDESDPFEQAFLHGYPNPDRIGCPGNEVLRALARKESAINHPARLHLGACSPCFREFKEFQLQYQREKKQSRWTSLAAGVLASRVSVLVFTSSVITLAAALVATYFGLENRRLHIQLGTMQSEHTRLSRQIATLPQSSGQQNGTKQTETTTLSAHFPIISLVLQPRDLTRGDAGGTEPTILSIPPNPPSMVVLVLRLPQDKYSDYAIVLQTPDEQSVNRVQGLKSITTRSGAKTLAVNFPSRLFENGTYIIMLRGRSDHQEMQIIDEYKFRVVK